MDWPQGSSVRNARFGLGEVVLDQGLVIIVRFDHGIESCARDELERVASLNEALHDMEWPPALRVMTRFQAEAIRSANDTWGVFSVSRIKLYPHQLWVCKQVNERWPAWWLVADDVGLGKTIEAGLILWPLLAKGVVRRLLVLTPASLVMQWQQRLREMFDIRLSPYQPDIDTTTTDYWNTHDRVVASLETLRLDVRERHDRLLQAKPWDMLIVDEAHHLSATEHEGATLGYQLVEKLRKEERIRSALFFTGTPHRGKTFEFLSLLNLLRPDRFDPSLPLAEQLGSLREVMIRNNKQSVTDLSGQRLFQRPVVTAATYHYSAEEAAFYEELTDFIERGYLYADRLGQTEGKAVRLVLITMQKLASSSVAAVRRALQRRLDMLQTRQDTFIAGVEDLRRQYDEASDNEDFDLLGRIDEALTAARLRLMDHEEQALRTLLHLAGAVENETKFQKILDELDTRFRGRSVLFFTEYKATQALLMRALLSKYGMETLAFINGDDRADDVPSVGESTRQDRLTARKRFNDGDARFMVSTEAGGEGIDLQENCHTLVHVDLPWNPMRLHQRVGRLNRIGQLHQVDVLTLRNPDTVEALIWDRLNEKIERIQGALSEVMDEPEDLLQLVLGMAPNGVFDSLFGAAGTRPKGQALSEWFDRTTATFGGQDAVRMVKDLVGNVARFDFQQTSKQIPKADLSDLETFFLSLLRLHGRQTPREDGGLAFITPEQWLTNRSVRRRYTGLVFDRDVAPGEVERVMGVGHPAFEQAQNEAVRFVDSVATVPGLKEPIGVFKISDRVTTGMATVRSVLVGVQAEAGGELGLLRDWEVLLRINTLAEQRRQAHTRPSSAATDRDAIGAILGEWHSYIESQIPTLDLPFRVPLVSPLGVLWPGGDA